jgi:hypothetical protein
MPSPKGGTRLFPNPATSAMTPAPAQWESHIMTKPITRSNFDLIEKKSFQTDSKVIVPSLNPQ